MREIKAVGCILIDDPMSGESVLSGLSFPADIAARPFDWRARQRPLPGLQALLHAVRQEFSAASLLARGVGCALALALAEQLPVERLALIEPRFATIQSPWRLRRLSAYAARNLALCVSDCLILEAAPTRQGRRIARGLSFSGRVTRLDLPAKTGAELYTICEKRVQEAIFAFLRGEEFPKNLAENREMRYNL